MFFSELFAVLITQPLACTKYLKRRSPASQAGASSYSATQMFFFFYSLPSRSESIVLCDLLSQPKKPFACCVAITLHTGTYIVTIYSQLHVRKGEANIYTLSSDYSCTECLQIRSQSYEYRCINC